MFVYVLLVLFVGGIDAATWIGGISTKDEFVFIDRFAFVETKGKDCKWIGSDFFSLLIVFLFGFFY